MNSCFVGGVQPPVACFLGAVDDVKIQGMVTYSIFVHRHSQYTKYTYDLPKMTSDSTYLRAYPNSHTQMPPFRYF